MTKGTGNAVVTRKADARSYETRALTLEPWISRPGSGIQDRDSGSSPQVNTPLKIIPKHTELFRQSGRCFLPTVNNLMHRA